MCGEKIKQNFLSHVHQPFFKSRVHAIFHPMGVDFSTSGHHQPDLNSPFSIIFYKGWGETRDEYAEGIRKLTEIAEKSRMFNIFVLESSVSKSTADGIRIFKDDYVDRLTEICGHDFMLFLPDDDHALMASGRIMDSVVMSLPVIGIRTDFADELAEKIGEFGFFFENVNQIIEFFSNVDVHFLARKRLIFLGNLRSAQTRLQEISRIQLQSVLES